MFLDKGLLTAGPEPFQDVHPNAWQRFQIQTGRETTRSTLVRHKEGKGREGKNWKGREGKTREGRRGKGLNKGEGRKGRGKTILNVKSSRAIIAQT